MFLKSRLTDGIGRWPLGVRGAAVAVDRAAELLRASAEELPDEAPRLNRVASAATSAAEALQNLALKLDAVRKSRFKDTQIQQEEHSNETGNEV